ncbi:MAG: NAD(P)H-dependent oxidoreductase subunit E [Rhodospirillaceae bacterium]|nr:NAD(P)H-dependent oxidoreductase subunit E [Rhodospirillaceae bacterium]
MAFAGRPGGRKGRARSAPKGRQLDPAALDQVRALLGGRPRRRDLLIEYLHLVQDRFGALSPAHLAALAHEMRLAMAEVYEVATFYAHFDVLGAGDAPPPDLTIRVCDSLSCALAGAETLIWSLKGHYNGDVRILRAPCMGRCASAPVAEVGHRHVDRADQPKVIGVVEGGDFTPVLPPHVDFEAYRADGGYVLLEGCLGDPASLGRVEAALARSGLRGLGGAGFPTPRKWAFVKAGPKPRFLCLNADEGEPGTFKDRFAFETDPHRVIEGMLLAAWEVEAEACYIYLRDEYPAAREILLAELPKVEAAGLAPPGGIHLRRGAGAYICGEESAMLESIEGKRGLPRHRPPYAAQVGLFGRPTLIHNVETVFWIRDIVEKGAAWFDAHGRQGRKGVRAFSVSGRVKSPGVKIAPAGITMAELLEEYCGGMAEGHAFKGYLPGGASGGILPAAMADIPLDFGTLEPYGCFIGSGAVVVLSDRDDMRQVALNLLRFFEDESCGQCTPCRAGTEKAVRLMQARVWDEGLLMELGQAMRDASICGLGQAAPNPIDCVLKHFREDVGLE